MVHLYSKCIYFHLVYIIFMWSYCKTILSNALYLEEYSQIMHSTTNAWKLHNLSTKLEILKYLYSSFCSLNIKVKQIPFSPTLYGHKQRIQWVENNNILLYNQLLYHWSMKKWIISHGDCNSAFFCTCMGCDGLPISSTPSSPLTIYNFLENFDFSTLLLLLYDLSQKKKNYIVFSPNPFITADQQTSALAFA